jgi:hypothetical protein
MFALAACSSETPDDHPDATVGPPDGGIPETDAGMTGLCPADVSWPNPACSRASECGLQDQEVDMCPGCRDYNRALCQAAACATPERLMGGDVYTLIVPVNATITTESFTGHVLSSVTAGGQTITCEDVYEDRVSLEQTCYNIIDTRRYGKNAQQGDTYRLPFTQFGSGLHVLFVVHAYDMEGGAGTRTGLSCTEWDIGLPGSGAVNVPGDTMQPL